VGGAYGFKPDWLVAAGGRDGYFGTVIEFIPGQNANPAAVVELDEEIVLPEGVAPEARTEVRGTFLVLELAYRGTDWTTRPTRIHVELCDFRPGPKRWQDRRQGVWVESHANYEIVDETTSL
jgi:hypothetical protein